MAGQGRSPGDGCFCFFVLGDFFWFSPGFLFVYYSFFGFLSVCAAIIFLIAG
jgi:hypothetical protein